MKKLLVLMAVLVCTLSLPAQEARSTWRSATEAELAAIVPARAPVIQERIETELRTASGITDGHGHYVAGVVLITAGYSAEGKYSHYVMAQVPVRFGRLQLPAGQYIFGWSHKDADTLEVRFFEAATGAPLGTVEASLDPSLHRVESFRIWPPGDKPLVQIGRFTFSYQL